MKSDMDLAIETAKLHLDLINVERDMVAGRIEGLPADSVGRAACEYRLCELDAMVADATAALHDAQKLQFRAAFVLPRRLLKAGLRGHLPMRRKRKTA